MQLPNSTVVTFKYDPFGRRIQKSGASITNYIYDGDNAIEEVDQIGSLLAHYSQGAGIDELLSELRSGAVSYYEQDGLGSVTSLSGGGGTLANTYVYDSFGNLSGSAGTVANPYQYTGRDYDLDTGLRYYRARYYDATIGRFVSEDPIRFAGSSSFYVYTQNRPVNATDLTGLKILFCSRAGFQNLGGIGNHSYLYDTAMAATVAVVAKVDWRTFMQMGLSAWRFREVMAMKMPLCSVVRNPENIPAYGSLG